MPLPVKPPELMATRLNHAGDAAIGQIIAAVDVKAVEVQAFLPTPQGPILRQAFLSCSSSSRSSFAMPSCAGLKSWVVPFFA